MIANLYIKNGCFTISIHLKTGGLKGTRIFDVLGPAFLHCKKVDSVKVKVGLNFHKKINSFKLPLVTGQPGNPEWNSDK